MSQKDRLHHFLAPTEEQRGTRSPGPGQEGGQALLGTELEAGWESRAGPGTSSRAASEL